MTSEWLERWEKGHTGWHEANGSAALRKFWPGQAGGSRVLVPLCGKSPDLVWLSQQGCDVTGVEISEIATRAFFDEADIRFEVSRAGGLRWFRSVEHSLTIVCGDYFSFTDEPFDALYDRAALVALPPEKRTRYVMHTKKLLKSNAKQLLITLEYDQKKVSGPPFSVLPDEVKKHWPELRRAGELSALKNMPPKYRDAGLSRFVEAVWVSEEA